MENTKRTVTETVKDAAGQLAQNGDAMTTTTWYVINTMDALGNGHVGKILSRHRSEDAAESAAGKLQRAVRRANGQGSYLPTIVRSSADIRADGSHAYHRAGGLTD